MLIPIPSPYVSASESSLTSGGIKAARSARRRGGAASVLSRAWVARAAVGADRASIVFKRACAACVSRRTSATCWRARLKSAHDVPVA
jgi:hypothetical protein